MLVSTLTFWQHIPSSLQRWLRIVAAAGRNWARSHAFSFAGALVFFTVFSWAPVMMVAVTPDVVLKWRDVLVGALTGAVLFTMGSSLIAAYLTLAAPTSVYGAAGSLVLVLLWVYYSALILLFSAALSRAHLEARGAERVPSSTAVCLHTELVKEAEGAHARSETDR